MSFYPNFLQQYSQNLCINAQCDDLDALIDSFFYWLQIMTCAAVPIRCVVTDSACHKVALTAVSAMRATRDSLV